MSTVVLPVQRTRYRQPGVVRVTRIGDPLGTGRPHGVPPVTSQGTLALDLDAHPGLPHAPELRLVSGGPGPVRAWAARFAQAVVDVMDGDRNPHQLIRCTSSAVQAEIVRRSCALNAVARGEQRRRRLRAQVRSMHVYQPESDVAEISVHVRHGQRSRAIAARIEVDQDRWICVALQFG